MGLHPSVQILYSEEVRSPFEVHAAEKTGKSPRKKKEMIKRIYFIRASFRNLWLWYYCYRGHEFSLLYHRNVKNSNILLFSHLSIQSTYFLYHNYDNTQHSSFGPSEYDYYRCHVSVPRKWTLYCPDIEWFLKIRTARTRKDPLSTNSSSDHCLYSRFRGTLFYQLIWILTGSKLRYDW